MILRLTLLVLLVVTCKPRFKNNDKTMIRVTGADGIDFTGAVGTAGSTSTVTGVTPQEFPFKPTETISGVIQKSAKEDLRELVVECWYNDTKAKETARTTVEFGVVAVTCRGP